MAITIKVTGLDAVIKKFENMPREFITEMDKSVKRSAYLVEGESKKVTPVDTGRLRASINSVFSILQAIIAPHTNYAIYVHRRKPFMQWGAENAIDDIKREFERAVKFLIEK